MALPWHSWGPSRSISVTTSAWATAKWAAAVTLMPLWGLSGIAGCLAWLWLSAGYLMQGRAGLRVRPVWWRMLLAGGLAAMPPLGLALWWGIAVHAEGFNLLLLGPSMLVPAGMLVWLKRQA